MEIQRINNAMSFKNYTSDDLYRLEKKLDSLQASLDRNDLNSFYEDLPKSRRMPIPTGVPAYAMGGMYGMPPMPGMMPPMPMGGMYGMPMGMPGGRPPINQYSSRISGQPCNDIFCPNKK